MRIRRNSNWCRFGLRIPQQSEPNAKARLRPLEAPVISSSKRAAFGGAPERRRCNAAGSWAQGRPSWCRAARLRSGCPPMAAVDRSRRHNPVGLVSGPRSVMIMGPPRTTNTHPCPVPCPPHRPPTHRKPPSPDPMQNQHLVGGVGSGERKGDKRWREDAGGGLSSTPLPLARRASRGAHPGQQPGLAVGRPLALLGQLAVIIQRG